MKTNTEVIFHDKIDIRLVRFIWFREKSDLEKAKKLVPISLANRFKLLPKTYKKIETTPMQSLSFINNTSKPCKVFSSNYRYDGVPIPLYFPNNPKTKFKSSLIYVKDIARKAGMEEDNLKKFHDIPTLERYIEKNGLFEKEWISHGR